MTEQENAAYVFAMAVGAHITAMGMVAENQHRLQRGETVAYNQKAFDDVVAEWGCHHNAILTSLQP